MGRYPDRGAAFATRPPCSARSRARRRDGEPTRARRSRGLRAQPGRRLELDARPVSSARSMELVDAATREEPGATTASPTTRRFAAAIGQRLGEMHAGAGATPTDDPAFAPETAAPATSNGWAERRRSPQVERAFGAAARHAPDWAGRGDRGTASTRLLSQQRAVDRPARAPGAGRPGALKTRIHGDFHLGQVLVAQGDVYHHRLRGRAGARRSPSAAPRPVRCATSPGMLRSFDYAAAGALDPNEVTTTARRRREQREAFVERVARRRARRAFLDGYRQRAAGAGRGRTRARRRCSTCSCSRRRPTNRLRGGQPAGLAANSGARRCSSSPRAFRRQRPDAR